MLKQASLAVDTIQNGKKQFINKYISNPILAKSWHEYVDSQAIFVKAAMETTFEMVSETNNTIMETKIKKMVNPFNIDWFAAGWDALVQQGVKETAKTKTASKKAE
jgi:hypothetical protein